MDDALAADEDLAAVGLGQAGKDPDQGGLARAVRPDQAVHLAWKDREGDAFQRLRAAVSLADCLH